MAGAPLYFSHPASFGHETGEHPERPDRITAIERELERREWCGYERREAPPASREALATVHAPEYLDAVRSLSEAGQKLQYVRQQTGALACEACGFDSNAQYGVEGIIECHHLKPVRELHPGERTRLADLRLVCPNCHRLIHKREPWLSWEELLDVIRRAD